MFCKDISQKNFEKIFCLVLFATINYTQVLSQFALPIEEVATTMCPEEHNICTDGTKHYLCLDTISISPNCTGFDPIIMTDNIRKQFTDGHNGIRNKVADDFSIANMNLLYYSRHLETVARNYLKLCKIMHDPCNYIGFNDLEVNTNILFRNRHLIDRWPSRAVRQWYLELGAEVSTGQEFLARRKEDHTYAVNFSQMTWPKTEFLGCSAAKMFHGYFLVCYYHPPVAYSIEDTHVFVGQGCTRCPRLRPVCSRVFNSLCGMDFPMDSAQTLAINKMLYTILFLIFWMF